MKNSGKKKRISIPPGAIFISFWCQSDIIVNLDFTLNGYDLKLREKMTDKVTRISKIEQVRVFIKQ